MLAKGGDVLVSKGHACPEPLGATLASIGPALAAGRSGAADRITGRLRRCGACEVAAQPPPTARLDSADRHVLITHSSIKPITSNSCWLTNAVFAGPPLAKAARREGRFGIVRRGFWRPFSWSFATGGVTRWHPCRNDVQDHRCDACHDVTPALYKRPRSGPAFGCGDYATLAGGSSELQPDCAR